jgi:5'/3'-nucleotidase
VAVSVDSYELVDFTPAAEFARRVTERVCAEGLPDDTFLNVNVPAVPAGEIAGVSVTRQGRAVFEGGLEERRDPRGRPYYWWSGGRSEVDAPPGSDVEALLHRRISVTPVKLDLTADAFLSRLEQWNLTRPE